MSKPPGTIKELAAKMEDISRSLYEDLDKLKAEIHNTVDSGEQLQSKEILFNKIESLENKVNVEFGELRSEIKILTEFANKIQDDVDNLLQNDHNKKILIHGIQENDNPIYEEIIEIIDRNINIVVDKNEVCNCYRLGKKVSGKNRPVVMEFTQQWRRDEIFYNKNKLKGSSILITEMLTRSNYARFQQLNKRFKEDCWTRYGKTIVKINGQKIVISSDEQMKKVLR